MSRESRAIEVILLSLGLATGLSDEVAAAGSSQRQLACSRGQLEVCASILAQPRLAPGVRAAIEHLLADVAADGAACDARDAAACARLLERLPELPASMREIIAAALAQSQGR